MKRLFKICMALVFALGMISVMDTPVQAKSNKVLVVYFSATGNTERVAKNIAKATNADIFKITPKDPYTDDDLDWTDDNSRVVKEHEDEDLQEKVELTTTTVDDWDDYDTVFVGYPIWWGDAAWPINQFIEKNDFSGKTVIPFCTSSSSSIGQSGQHLADKAGTGTWKKGRRFSENASRKSIRRWARKAVQ